MRDRRTKRIRKRRIPYTAALLVPALIVVLSVTGYQWTEKDLTVVVDGESVEVHTHADRVASVLQDAHIPVDTDDIVSPSRLEVVESGDTVVVRHTVPVNVDLGSGQTTVPVAGTTVAEALVAAGADERTAGAVATNLDQRIEPGMTIDLPTSFVRVHTAEETVAPSVVTRRDPGLAPGAQRIIDDGRPGRVLRVYRVTVTNGVEGARELAAESVIAPSRPCVVAVGPGSGPRATRTSAQAAGVSD